MSILNFKIETQNIPFWAFLISFLLCEILFMIMIFFIEHCRALKRHRTLLNSLSSTYFEFKRFTVCKKDLVKFLMEQFHPVGILSKQGALTASWEERGQLHFTLLLICLPRCLHLSSAIK